MNTKRREAHAYLNSLTDPREYAHVDQMIRTWTQGGKWPSMKVQTVAMRHAARILKGET